MQITVNSSNLDFAAAGSAVIRFLHDRLGFGLWMVTRTEGEDWIVLQAEDHGYGVVPNTVFRWADSFCSKMVRGEGPRIAPDSNAVPVYAASPIGRQVKIGAYVGVPITNEDGSLFGTLCGIDMATQPDAIAQELPLVELLATMLSSILTAELRITETERRLERARAAAEVDALTELCNRRGWDRLLTLEEARCCRYGHPASVVVIDLDDLKAVNDSDGHDAGDDLLRRAALTLRKNVRGTDVVARLGGDEFGILGLECDPEESARLLTRICGELDSNGIRASAGLAMRVPGLGLEHARREADRAMYEHKAKRKPGRFLSRGQ